MGSVWLRLLTYLSNNGGLIANRLHAFQWNLLQITSSMNLRVLILPLRTIFVLVAVSQERQDKHRLVFSCNMRKNEERRREGRGEKKNKILLLLFINY